jgi:micrococcal nuclease
VRFPRPLALVVLALAACSDVPGTALPSDAAAAEPSAAPTAPPATEAPASTTAAPEPAGLPAGRDTVLERVVDGDTIVVSGGERVRLIGIDTPETVDPRRPVQCFGREASAHMAELLPPGTAVRLVADVEATDRYGRTLSYVYRAGDGLFVNAAMVEAGFAVTATYPPNVAHADDLAALAREAREAGRGLWSACEEDAAPAAPPTTTAPVQALGGGGGGCDPAYPDVCIPPAPPDLDCGQIPHRRFRVLPPDPHRFDADRDGVGCES